MAGRRRRARPRDCVRAPARRAEHANGCLAFALRDVARQRVVRGLGWTAPAMRLHCASPAPRRGCRLDRARLRPVAFRGRQTAARRTAKLYRLAARGLAESPNAERTFAA